MAKLCKADVASFWRVIGFGVFAHGLDMLTTYWRDPHLLEEGNPLYRLLAGAGIHGWSWLLAGKMLWVAVAALLYWCYLLVRRNYLPPEPVTNFTNLHSYSLYGRVMSRPEMMQNWGIGWREVRFIGVVLAGVALPVSSAAAIVYSFDNAAVPLHFPWPRLPWGWFGLVEGILALIWWCWAWWQFYQQTLAATQTA